MFYLRSTLLSTVIRLTLVHNHKSVSSHIATYIILHLPPHITIQPHLHILSSIIEYTLQNLYPPNPPPWHPLFSYSIPHTEYTPPANTTPPTHSPSSRYFPHKGSRVCVPLHLSLYTAFSITLANFLSFFLSLLSTVNFSPVLFPCVKLTPRRSDQTLREHFFFSSSYSPFSSLSLSTRQKHGDSENFEIQLYHKQTTNPRESFLEARCLNLLVASDNTLGSGQVISTLL